MAKKMSKNASGRWLQMSDQQLANENAKFQRAVERQQAKDAERAAAAKAPTYTCPSCGETFQTQKAVVAHFRTHIDGGHPKLTTLPGRRR